MSRLRFGIMTLQNLPYLAMVERWRRLDALDFDSVWLGDHFVDPFCPTEPWFEGWTLLGALAAQTSRIRVGALVSSLTLRNPAMLARHAMTADHISGGRFELGIGAAGRPLDHTMTGIATWEPRERMQRFRECVEIVDRALREPVTTYEGRCYRIAEAVMNPPPVQQPRPPLTLAAHGRIGLQIVARFADVWNSLGKFGVSAREALEATRDRNRMLDDYAAGAGRNPRGILRSLLCGFTPDRPFASPDALDDFVGRYREIGIDEFIFYWLTPAGHPVFPDRGLGGVTITDTGQLERVAAALSSLREAGDR